MGSSIGDGIAVAAIAAGVFGYFYLKHLERRRRLEIVHEERLAAMDKGIPLPELPIDPPRVPRRSDPRDVLIHGFVWTSLGAGAMLMLRIIEGPAAYPVWPYPLPIALLGVGLILYYFLAGRSAT